MTIIEQAKNYIDSYISPYVLSNKTTKSQLEKFNRKHAHMYRVAELSRTLSTSLNMSETDIEIANLIGIMHDIGRIKQILEFDSMKDFETFDHGTLGANIVKDLDFIKSYYDEENINVICTAIENHNKRSINSNIEDERTLNFCKLIRDADKIDILSLFSNDKEIENHLKNLDLEHVDKTISMEIMKSIELRTTVDKKDLKTLADYGIFAINLAFDINYSDSKKIIRERGYIRKLLNGLNKINNFSYIEKYYSEFL